MRRLEVLDALYLTFPGRSAEFDIGIEIGALCVLMAQGEGMICRRLSDEAVKQMRPLADRFGYSIIATPSDDGMIETSLVHRRYGRPKLRVV